jgi:hypothetical protein
MRIHPVGWSREAEKGSSAAFGRSHHAEQSPPLARGWRAGLEEKPLARGVLSTNVSFVMAITVEEQRRHYGANHAAVIGRLALTWMGTEHA